MRWHYLDDDTKKSLKEYKDKQHAQRREYAIKRLSWEEKERLIENKEKIQRIYFEYGDKEIDYLRRKDKRLGEAMDRIGHIDREVDGDLFSSVVHSIIAQQISSAALKTIWLRLTDRLGSVNPDTVCATSRDEIQSCGISFRKADYIKDFSEKIRCGDLDEDALRAMPDKELISALSALKGIGVWTAEMLMVFCLQRPDVVSYGDLAIHRGMRMLYHHRKIDRKFFEKYACRYSPYGSVASLYLWAVAGGAIPEMRDPAPGKKVK